MIRVLQMVGSLDIGGSQAMLLNLYRNIDREKLGFDFVIDHPNELHYAEEVKALGARIYTMPRFNGRNARQVYRAWDEFFSAHPEYRVLHTHVPSYAAIFLAAAKKHGLRTIAHSHTASNGSGALGAVKGLMQYPLRFQADVLMACSDKAGRLLFGERALRGEKYVFFPNAIDTERFKPDERVRREYRSKMGLDGKTVIGHVGRMSEVKNHGFLIEAFARAYKKNNMLRLLLVGDGEIRGELEQRIRALSIEQAVILTGGRDDVAGLMQAMDVFAFPSLWEGLPVTLIEAQAAGLPCIISDTISRDADLSALIKRLPIDNTDTWAEELLKEHARMDASEEIKRAGFDIRESVRKISEIYTKLDGEDNDGR